MFVFPRIDCSAPGRFIKSFTSEGNTFFSKSLEEVELKPCCLSHLVYLRRCQHYIFSGDEATLYEGVSVRPFVGWMVGRSVTSYFILGATYAVYTALFFKY